MLVELPLTHRDEALSGAAGDRARLAARRNRLRADGAAPSTAVALGVTVAIWTLGEIVSSPVAGAYVADLSPERLRGRYMGAWSFTWGSASWPGRSRHGPLCVAARALWLACLVLGALAAARAPLSPARRVQPDTGARGGRARANVR